jgi:hypothetical protein
VSWADRIKRRDRPTDPYFVWADLTGLWGMLWGSRQTRDRLTVLFELSKRYPIKNVFSANEPRLLNWSRLRTTSFKTASVAISAIGGLIARVERLMLCIPRGVVVQEGFPNQGDLLDPVVQAQQPGLAVAQAIDLPRPVVVGIIDDGCPLGHAGLGNRLLGLWHQGAAGGTLGDSDPGDEQLRGFTAVKTGTITIGLLVPPTQLAFRVFQTGQEFRWLPNNAPLPTIYQDTGYLHPVPAYLHGLHVADVAAGAVDPIRRRRGASRSQPPPDFAFVQLPRQTVSDTSGGSLAAHVLDGIHYILEAAGPSGQGASREVIANVSYGTHGGPHDGTSMLERAMLELLGLENGEAGRHRLHIVLPAGNGHLARGHAGGELKQHDKRELRWRVLPDDPTPSFMEVWVPFDADVRITLQSPSADPPLTAGAGHLCEWVDGTELRAAVIFPKSVVQGTKGTMALLAVAPTRAVPATGGAPRSLRAPHGVWTVVIENTGAWEVRFDAWIERDDVAPGRRRGGRQSYLIDTDRTPVEPERTLNGIATAVHDRLHVVGASCLNDDRLTDYTAAGPDRLERRRRDGPDVVVPGDRSASLSGLRAGGAREGIGVFAGGTSVAAALYTRLLAEARARSPANTGPPWLPPNPPTTATRPPIDTLGAPRHAQPPRRGEGRRRTL